ncbi:hypothetical protein ACOSQ4_008081 [Xanthoceras sorbifolium]
MVSVARPIMLKSCHIATLSLDGKSSFAPKTHKAVKPQPVFTSRTTKKSTKTKECNAASSSSTKTLNHREAKQEDEKDCQDHHDQVTEDKDVREIQVHDQIPKLENNIEEEADNGDHHEETQGGEEELGEEISDHHHEIRDKNKVEEKYHDHGDQEGGGDLEAAAKQEAGNGNSATASAVNKWPDGKGKK